jgi:tRNA pseudouridine55 synthase
MDGVLVVDKPKGPTSFDVVARVRRALKTKRVGHAGTLDPMATGVLVVLVGEATKLEPFLVSEDKAYLAHLAFGRATDTLDAEGRVTEEREVPAWLIEELASASGPSGARIDDAIRAELTRTEQTPPAFSAIHVDGKRAYDLARAGKPVELPPRAVEARSITRVASDDPTLLALELRVSKGYYVRSLARDLGERLGVPAHLARLRRTKSGSFDLTEAALLDAPDLASKLLPIARAAERALAIAKLTDEGTLRARQGKLLDPASADHFVLAPPDAVRAAWLDPTGALVAVGSRSGDTCKVERGFQGDLRQNAVIQ